VGAGALLPLRPQPRVLACFSTNQAALSVHERVGFVGKGTLRQAVYIDGKYKYMDVVVVGILRNEYGDTR
jgi:RimJ/RimL family protein N-acetyltransferase